MNNKVRWGIVSTAKIATEKVIPAMQLGDWSEVEAIASRDPSKAQEVANRFSIPKACSSYEELLADRQIEAIQSSSESPARAVDRQGGRGRQARALRKTDS